MHKHEKRNEVKKRLQNGQRYDKISKTLQFLLFKLGYSIIRRFFL